MENPALAYFTARGMADRIRTFDGVSSATVALAAAAIGCPEPQIAKTLSFRRADGCLLVVAAGDARVDNKKFKEVFGFRASMLTPEQALAGTGYAVGGVCPFALPADVPVYLDRSLRRFDIVYAACGSSRSVIGLTLPELELHTNGARWTDVCTRWEEDDI